jgi:hypothetical protein
MLCLPISYSTGNTERIRSHVLTGSYHNYFRIYDTETLNDVVLQADKSAFKAKKTGGPLPGGKPGVKNGTRPGGLRDAMQLETLDFNKKILHASWHPRENTIAVNSLLLLYLPWYTNLSERSPPRTICSCIVRHNACSITIRQPTVITMLHHTPKRDSQSSPDRQTRSTSRTQFSFHLPARCYTLNHCRLVVYTPQTPPPSFCFDRAIAIPSCLLSACVTYWLSLLTMTPPTILTDRKHF